MVTRRRNFDGPPAAARRPEPAGNNGAHPSVTSCAPTRSSIVGSAAAAGGVRAAGQEVCELS
jgi:hypothetical protein